MLRGALVAHPLQHRPRYALSRGAHLAQHAHIVGLLTAMFMF